MTNTCARHQGRPWRGLAGRLDEEIMLKTHFLPGCVRDVEDAIRWCNQREMLAF